MAATSITETDFDYVRGLMRERSGMVLEPGKEYLLESRLSPVARREGFASLQALMAHLRAKPLNGLHQTVVEALTTNETSFFRDFHPFEALRQEILPRLMVKRSSERRLRIWCGACASGQEPYSIAMLLRDQFPALDVWLLQIIATDLSTAMLERAQRGRYSQSEVNRGLPAALLIKYFKKAGVEWELRDEIRKMVEFHQMNLASWWPALPKMDIIFMRNVLIYLDTETRKAILSKVRRLLRPDGYLFLGGAETTFSIDSSFTHVQFGQSVCYQLRD